MRYVGLTGNIASGKSEVARLLAQHGATIIDADLLARRAVEPGTEALAQIVARWGPRMLAPNGTLDRTALRRAVFGAPDELAALNAIVHPVVAAFRTQALEAARERGDALVVYVVPLLFEAKVDDPFDAIVLVDAPEAVRLDRLVHGRGLDVVEAKRMIASQMPTEEKRAKATYVLENDGPLEALTEKVVQLWEQLTGSPPPR